ncbi:hypothetical protein QTN25_003867 [Entamoeba marina]
MEPPTSGPMCDLLWSDPLDQPHPESMDKRRLEVWLNTDYVDNHLRQTSVISRKRVDEELKQKIELLKEKTEKEFKEKHDVLELKKEIKAMKTINKDWFDKILRIDRNNEMRPKSCRVTRLTSRPKNIRTVSDSQITIPQQ